MLINRSKLSTYKYTNYIALILHDVDFFFLEHKNIACEREIIKSINKKKK
jgi:hypothetical protein